MRKLVKMGATSLSWLSLLSTIFLFLINPPLVPFAIIPSLLFALASLANAVFKAEGTALKASVVWAILAVLLAILSQTAALSEPFQPGRPLTGHLTYLCVLTTLAALISVLNARTPGGGAWAILMSLLILVFLIPWLESSGIGRPTSITLNRLRLDNPWTIFYGLVVLAGVTNYLPTRYFLAASFLALGFLLEYIALTHIYSPPTRAALWSAFPFCLSAAIASADRRSRTHPDSSSPLEAAWFWFRDRWGVVWALRVLERFNRSAESQNWPIRLSWQGVVPFPQGSSPPPEIPKDAFPLLLSLLRRFASPDRVEQAIQHHSPALASLL